MHCFLKSWRHVVDVTVETLEGCGWDLHNMTSATVISAYVDRSDNRARE